MNIKALIKKYEAVECVVGIVSGKTILKTVLKDLKQLDEPETGHADEAPRYLKNILARLRELPDHDREVWLKAIMSEFKQDFSHAKWREGYEQGKLEGMVEREKVKVKQFVADWYEENKDSFEFNVWDWIAFRDEAKKIENREFNNWINDSRENPIQILVNMHQFGYEIEKEKQYLVKIKATKHYLVKDGNGKIFFSLAFKGYFTKKELEEAGFGWVFDCPGIEIEEVEV
ncbi:conserved hypothetical protein [Streptococcus mitis SK564]|uniref:Phage protein n=1 Tax=Streptococcus mitis SK564 TaxID=585203 RepID=E1LN29_STRMT|nr:DUF1642 domain-containing protein [Streptococcus mitis]EFN98340.1 conserved hypothetical protein [Streptococcus mitis SK564]